MRTSSLFGWRGIFGTVLISIAIFFIKIIEIADIFKTIRELFDSIVGPPLSNWLPLIISALQLYQRCTRIEEMLQELREKLTT